MRRAWALTGVLALTASAGAHHSTAHYREELREFEGEIAEVIWRNPHIGIVLRTTNASGGDEELWQMESNSTYNLQRAGITRDLLNVGDRVRVAGQPSTLEERAMLVTNLMLPSGTEIVLRRDMPPLWTGEAIGGREEWLAGRGVVDAAAENLGLFRVWSASEVRITKEDYPFTDTAIAGRSGWNTLDNFMTNCEGPGMPYLMTSPHPHQFARVGDDIELRVQFFDRVRTIHMAPAAEPATAPPSDLGYSVGRWEDNTLVVETSRIDFPYFDRIGTRQSENAQLIERFTLSDDQSRLGYHMTIVDPTVFTRPATMETTWIALGDDVSSYDCLVF